MTYVDAHILNQAIRLYFSEGKSPFPKRDIEAVLAAFGADAANYVVKITDEMISYLDCATDGWSCQQITEKYSTLTDQLRCKYPELSKEASEVIMWVFSYANR